MKIWKKYTVFIWKSQLKPFFEIFWIILGTLKTWIVLILRIVVLIMILKITQPWLLQMLNFHFKSLKVKNEPIAWPYLCLKRPFHGDFRGTLSVQIWAKMAEKARCQFPWPSFWPCKLVPSNASAIYEQLYTTAQKVVFPSHDAIHQIVSKNAKTVLDSIFNILE